MSRLRSQAGFTLIELIVAMTISTMTVLAVFAILDTTIKQSNAVAGRVNATQRGRITMDTITRQLRSQVCYSATVPALVSGDRRRREVPRRPHATARKPIEQHELVFNPTARTLTERVWPGQGSPLTFPTTDAEPAAARRRDPRAGCRTARSSRSSGTTPTTLATPPRPTLRLPTPLSATDLAPRGEDRGRLHDPAAGRQGRDGRRRRHAPERDLRPRRGSQRPSTHSHMRLIPRIRTRFLAAEHGFSMIVVMGVMAASSLFVAAAFAAANGDLPLTRDSQDRKQAYAAAEAGINYYQYHLNQDPDYWTRCTNVPAPNATENQPVNQTLERHRHRPAPLAQGRGHADRSTRSSCCRPPATRAASRTTSAR